MKHFYLIRHAKSSWSDSSLADIDRPLNKRGERDAPFMGERLSQAGILFDLMLSSPAKRARKTARIIAGKVGYRKKDIVFNDDIYTADLMVLQRFVCRTGDAVGSLALVGHNYVLTEFAEWLTGEVIVNIPTSGIVAIDFDADSWKTVRLSEAAWN